MDGCQTGFRQTSGGTQLCVSGLCDPRMDSVSIRGVELPALGLGTWPMTGTQCTNAVTAALEFGYRHVDTAQMYDNEDAIGAAIADSSVDRDDVFVTTKLLRENLRRDDALASFQRSLERLGTDYVTCC